MSNSQKFVVGSLTLIDPTQGTILGELSDAKWNEEKSSGGVNYVLSGMAGDGSLDSIVGFIETGHDTVDYILADEAHTFRGQALLLKPGRLREGAGTEIRIESPTKPEPEFSGNLSN